MALMHEHVKGVGMLLEVAAHLRANAGLEHGVWNLQARSLHPITDFVEQSSGPIGEVAAVFPGLAESVPHAAGQAVSQYRAPAMSQPGIQQVHGGGAQRKEGGGSKEFHASISVQGGCANIP